MDMPLLNAQNAALSMLQQLGIEEAQSYVTLTRVDGKAKKGWRVTVCRLSDGMTTTEFVRDRRA